MFHVYNPSYIKAVCLLLTCPLYLIDWGHLLGLTHPSQCNLNADQGAGIGMLIARHTQKPKQISLELKLRYLV